MCLQATTPITLLQYDCNLPVHHQLRVTGRAGPHLQVRVKKFVPNKKGDVGMEVYYLCQPNTYVIAITAAHQIHEQ